MCGILGARILPCEKSYEFCKKLMRELTIRGTHAFGIAYYKQRDNKYYVKKSFNPIFDEFMLHFDELLDDGFIFHNRYCTSGDWEVMKNNQPIVVQRVGAIAMNGVLTMKTKKEYEEEYGVKCDSDNDAEIFLRKIEQGVNLEEFLKQEKRCSFAGVFLKKNSIIGIRNNKRPLYHYVDGTIGSFIVSTLDTIRRAGGNIRNAKIIKPFERCYI